ncbi:MAG: rRNA maturation RNase YbeY [Bacilli bacterium]
MNRVGIFNESNMKINKEITIIKKLINYAIAIEREKNLEFNIIFVNNEKIRELNRTYRRIDDYTDVISFALEDYSDINYVDKRLLGDIYISVDKAKEQAQTEKHSLLWELSFLAIHGFLHLLGYNHENEDDKNVMFSKQELMLNGYGIKK